MLIRNVMLEKSEAGNELSAQIDGFRVWMRVPAHIPLCESPDPFIAIGCLEAMSRDGSIKVECRDGVSETLLANLEELNLIYCNWNQDFKPLKIDTNRALKRQSRTGFATYYSGGVDSMFTLLRHGRKLTHMVRLFGYDFNESVENIRQIVQHDQEYAELLGKQYIPIESNFHEYRNKRNIDIESFWGFPLYAAAYGLGFESFIIPSSHTYSELFPASSHPLVDPLWSNGQVNFRHDILIRRSDKIKQIVQESHALANLHVCWKHPIENCGSCSKCIRTGVTLRLLGVETNNFPVHSSVDKLKNLKVTNESGVTFLVDNLILAKEQEDHEIEHILRKRLRYYQRSQLAGQFDSVFTRGILRYLYRRWKEPDWLSAITLSPKERLY